VTQPSDYLTPASLKSGDFPTGKAQPPAILTVPLSVLYGFAATVYHSYYDTKQVFRADVPVISVGNLSVGGTGKTPSVIALVRQLMEWEPEFTKANAITVLSRGYGRVSNEMVVVEQDGDYRNTGDEPLLIKRSLGNSGVVVHSRREWGARYAVERLGSRLLVLDDGFQHRRLGRDLDLVVMDGAEPLGNGYLLPAGPLREKPEALRRASAFIAIGAQASGAQSLAERFEKPLITAVSTMILPEELSTKLSTPIYVLTSIARPRRFLKGLRDKGLRVAGGQAFPDHHRFEAKELAAVANYAKQCGAKMVVTTAKDRIRIREWPFEIPLAVVGLEMRFTNPEILQKLLLPLIQTAKARMS
jgi:tetraacyldisaccharide 4'-kinase